MDYWKLARKYYPELPDYPEDLLEIGMVLESEDFGKGVFMSLNPDGTATVLINKELYDIDLEWLEPTGEIVPLGELIQTFMDAKGNNIPVPEHPGSAPAGKKAPFVVDEATGEEYQTIEAFCRDAGMSRTSAYTMLRGERDSIRGHALRYKRK